MLVLGLESATPVAGAALIEDEELRAEINLKAGKTHSQQLLPIIKDIFNQCRFKLEDIDGIAVSIGPGSFTGLRIGLAAAKGLAYVLDRPLIGINTLDSMAHILEGKEDRLISPVLYARRQEIYTAVYRHRSDRIKRVSEYFAVNPETWARFLATMEEPVILLGDGVERFRECFSSIKDNRFYFFSGPQAFPRALLVARLGLKKLRRGEKDHLFSLTPFYIRASEAEIRWLSRHC